MLRNIVREVVLTNGYFRPPSVVKGKLSTEKESETRAARGIDPKGVTSLR